MYKELNFESMDKMLVGFDKVADAAIGTLGPKGRNVFIDGDIPKISNDGANIVTAITLKDKLENVGAYVIKNACSQTADDAGDATTTTASLAKAILHESLKRPEPIMEVEESLKKAGDKILNQLLKKSIKIKKEDIYNVALTTAQDENLAKKITEIFNKLGDKAVINIEDSKTFSTDYEITDGYEAKVGFMSPLFINDRKTARAEYKDIPVLCTAKKISNMADIAPIFNNFAFEMDENGKIRLAPNGKPIPSQEPINSCVIVCEDIDDSMLGILANNFQMKIFNALVIRATGPLLEDIAGYTGAKLISDQTGHNFQNFRRDYLGFAKKVSCDAIKTLFIGDGKTHKQYVKEFNVKVDGEPNMFTKKSMEQRLAKLNGGIAVLRIGASTDLEREYLKDKADDTKRAVAGALEEGIVEGGGMALWRISHELTPKTIGEKILKQALTAPLRDMLVNANEDYTEIILNMPDGMGYDIRNNKYTEMIKSGIIDTYKAERCALENAVGAVSKFRTVFLTITDKEDEKN